MIPSEHLITEDARKRLGVLRELDDLGAGFRLAARDMEIRGAGNLLGKQQSGQIKAIGFELFLGMLEQAAAEVRGDTAEPDVEPEIDLGAHAFLPENYIEDVGERLLLYRRLANAGSARELDRLRGELEDRFGPLPDPARDFLSVMSLRPTLKRLAVESLKATETLIVVRFDERSPIDSDALLSLVHSAPKRYRLRPPAALTARISTETWAERFDEVESLLATLAASVATGRSAVAGADAHA